MDTLWKYFRPTASSPVLEISSRDRSVGALFLDKGQLLRRLLVHQNLTYLRDLPEYMRPHDLPHFFACFDAGQ